MDQALRLDFPPTQVALFGKQDVLILRTHASFRIEGYQLPLDCDHQYAFASLAEVNAPRLLTADNSSFDPGCTWRSVTRAFAAGRSFVARCAPADRRVLALRTLAPRGFRRLELLCLRA